MTTDQKPEPPSEGWEVYKPEYGSNLPDGNKWICNDPLDGHDDWRGKMETAACGYCWFARPKAEKESWLEKSQQFPHYEPHRKEQLSLSGRGVPVAEARSLICSIEESLWQAHMNAKRLREIVIREEDLPTIEEIHAALKEKPAPLVEQRSNEEKEFDRVYSNCKDHVAEGVAHDLFTAGLEFARKGGGK